ncbi:MAG: copper resistance protein CopC [Gemmatimonadaceae bacterium]
MTVRVRRRARALAAATLLAVITPALAVAHGELKSSRPAAGSRLTVAPREIRLEFNEPPELAFTSAVLLGPDGTAVALDSLRPSADSPRVVVAAIRGALSAGQYAIMWTMGGADGHPVRGRVRFTILDDASGLGVAMQPRVAPPSSDPTPAEGADHPGMEQLDMTAPPAFGAESWGYVAIRWIQFTSLVIILGAVAFHAIVLGVLRRRATPSAAMIPPANAGAATLALWATMALAISALLRVVAQSYAIHGAGNALNASMLTGMVTQTAWGLGWLAQLPALALAVAGFARARRRSSNGWHLATVGAVLLAFTPALSGHAMSAPRLVGLAVVADAMHVTSAGGWLGSLLLVIAVGLPAAATLPEGERRAAVVELVNAFSISALVFATAAATTGVFAAWLHLESVAALWTTSYGQTLLVKLGVLSGVAAVGAYNWRVVKPSLHVAEGESRLRRSAKVELAIGLVVLLVTAVLVATPPTDGSTVEGTFTPVSLREGGPVSVSPAAMP